MQPTSKARLTRLRLAAQRLTPESAASDPVAAARAVVGIQAQDVRAMGLSLRSRVPSLEREALLEESALIRTWTVRGTVHLIASDDHPWIHELTAARNLRYFENLLDKRGNLPGARALLPHLLDTLAEVGPMTRAELLRRLSEDGHPPVGGSSDNILIPWAAVQGVIAGLPDGRFRAAEPPPPVDEDEALLTLGRRYLEGFGPAAAADLAKWSGLPVSQARRALDAVDDAEQAGDLRALPGTLDDDPHPAPAVLLLAPFDTSMLGWRTREPLVASADDAHVLPGGGIVRAAVLARGRAVGTWRVGGSGRRRRLELEIFGRAPAVRPLSAEAADVARFLGIELVPAS